MPVLVKIGYQFYLVRNERSAASVISALAGAVKFERDYSGEKGDRYYPDDDQTEVGLITVRASQLLAAKPGTKIPESDADVTVAPERKPLRRGARQLLLEDRKL